MEIASTEIKTVEQVKTFLDDSWRAYQHGRPWERHEYVYASGYHPCKRKMVYDMTAGDQRPPWTPDQLCNFQRGKDREENIKADMREIGRSVRPRFELIRDQERFIIKDAKGRDVIHGRVEGFIHFETGLDVVYEIKSWSSYLTANIETFGDLLANRWTRAGARQILAYMYASHTQFGLFILDRHGLPYTLPIDLENGADLITDFCDQASASVDHVNAGTLPAFINDYEECKHCDYFGTICQPDTYTKGASFLLDADLEASLLRRDEILTAIARNQDGGELGQFQELRKEFDALDKAVKERLRNVESGICGDFLISGKGGFRKGFSVKEANTWTVKISRMGKKGE